MFSAKKKGEKCIFNPISRKYQSQRRRLTFYINCMISLNETLQNEKKKKKSNSVSGKKNSKGKKSCDVEFLP